MPDRRYWLAGATVGFVGGPIVGYLDVVLHLILHGRGIASLHFVLLTAAVEGLAFAIGTWLLWAILCFWKSWGAHEESKAIGTAYAIGIFFAGVTVFDLLSLPGWWIETHYAKATVTVLVTLLAAFLGYHGARRCTDLITQRDVLRSLAGAMHLLAPFVFSSAAMWELYGDTYLPQIVSPSLAIAGWVACLIAGAGMLCLILRAQLGASMLRIALFVGFILGPWVLYVVRESPQTQTPSGTPTGPRFVFLLIADTLRADALSCYRDTGAEGTPNIDALSNDAIQFQNAMSCAPWTLPSVESIMTGLSPGVHGATKRFGSLSSQFKTLAESYHEAGYRTIAVGSNAVLPRPTGFSQGFDEYIWYPRLVLKGSIGQRLLAYVAPSLFGEEASTTDLVDIAIAQVRQNLKTPLFLWLHIYDPHMTYAPPSKYLDADDTEIVMNGTEFSEDEWDSIRIGTSVPSSTKRSWIRRLYQAEVRYVDDEYGRFLGFLKNAGIYDDSLIVFLSDHGEEFWEHGGLSHGHSLHRELLHVPLIIKLPHANGHQRIDELVSLDCVVPTMLDLCEVSFEEEFLTGLSLRAQLESGSWMSQNVYATGQLLFADQEAIISRDFKYVKPSDSSPEVVFDLIVDPWEISPILADPRVEIGRQLMLEHRTRNGQLREHYGFPAVPSDSGITPEMQAILESVGYLQ